MGNIVLSYLGFTSSPGESEDDKAAINNRKGVSISSSEHANGHLIMTTDQPDSVAHIRDQGEEKEEIYVQVTVLTKKLRTKKDGTIILSPISESLVS